MLPLGEDLYAAECSIRFYGFRLQTRMAVARLPGARLFVYSPVFLTPPVRAELDALGRVAIVVSPNKIHNQTLAAYAEAYPEAKLLAPPGLPERRRDLHFDALLADETDVDWGDELDCVLTAGNVFFSEALFFHRRSRTLLVGDLVENFDRRTASPLALAVAKLFGVPQRPVASPEFQLYTHDAAAAERSLGRAQAWAFERIFLCHGGLIESDAKAVFDAVCSELVDRARRRGALSKWILRRLAALQ